MVWRKRAHQGPPEAVRQSVPAGDRLAAASWDERSQQWIVASRTQLAVVSQDGEVQRARRWLEVDEGAWDPETDTLRVSWVDGSAPTSWQLVDEGARAFTDVFRDRVNASVVLVREVDLGPGRRARVAIRKDLATRELTDQVVLGRAARRDDAELAEHVAQARATLRDQSGLPPLGA